MLIVSDHLVVFKEVLFDTIKMSDDRGNRKSCPKKPNTNSVIITLGRIYISLLIIHGCLFPLSSGRQFLGVVFCTLQGCNLVHVYIGLMSHLVPVTRMIHPPVVNDEHC